MIKAYWIFNRSVQMSIPKMIIQACHGTDLIHEHRHLIRDYRNWSCKHRRKIFLIAQNDEIFNKIIDKLKEKEIIFFKIFDMGFTEFFQMTCTGIVIAPIDEEKIPGIVKHLPTIKDRDFI